MKNLNKVIVAILMMALTTMPMMARNDKQASPQVNKETRIDNLQKSQKTKKQNIKQFTYKPTGKYVTKAKVLAAAKQVSGVKSATWNSKTKKVTVKYDANKTSVSKIKAAVKKACAKKTTYK